MKPSPCLCPVCKLHPLKPRCGAFRSTCPPKPPEPGPCALTGIHVQLKTAADSLLEDGQPINFDTIVNQPGTTIEYNKATGIFTLTKEANYLVNWSIAVEGSNTSPFIRFALKVGGEIIGAAAVPISVGVISGSALVTAAPGTHLALINHTNDTIRLDAVTPIANLTIVST